MKWRVKGADISTGKTRIEDFDADDRAGAELAAKSRGIVPKAFWELPPAVPISPVALEEAYGLTRSLATWAIVLGILLAPLLFGVPLVVWGIVAIAKMNRERLRASVVDAQTKDQK